MNRMKKLFIITTIFVVPLIISAQEIMMDEEPSTIYDNKKGPDSKHYSHAYFAIGLASNHDQAAGAKIKIPNSWEIMLGMRYKLRIFSFYSLGLDGSYRYQRFRIQNESGSMDVLNPLSINFESGKKIFGKNSLGLEIYNRLKAGRGNNPGYFIDAGIRGEWNFSNKLLTINTFETPEYPAGKRKQKDRKLDYIHKTALTATGRIGFKKNIIYGNYRLSDLITNRYSTPELPRLTVGLQRAF